MAAVVLAPSASQALRASPGVLHPGEDPYPAGLHAPGEFRGAQGSGSRPAATAAGRAKPADQHPVHVFVGQHSDDEDRVAPREGEESQVSKKARMAGTLCAPSRTRTRLLAGLGLLEAGRAGMREISTAWNLPGQRALHPRLDRIRRDA